VILEDLDLFRPGPAPLIRKDARQAQEARFMDGSFDIYVHTPVQKVGGDKLRPEDRRDRFGVEEAKASLDKAYTWLEQRLRGPAWAAGEAFGLADCAAATAPVLRRLGGKDRPTVSDCASLSRQALGSAVGGQGGG